MSSPRLVVIQIDDGLITNDLTHPPTPMVFEMVEVLSDRFLFRLTSVKEHPYLGYHLEEKKLNLTSSPVFASQDPMLDDQRLFKHKRVELKTERGSLGEWYLYVDPLLIQTYTEPTQTHSSNQIQDQTQAGLFLVFFVILVILMMMFWLV